MIDTLATRIIGFALLFGPYIWEVVNDQFGDFNKRFDFYIRCVLIVFVASANAFMNDLNIWFFVWSANLSIAIFFMFFDLTIAFLLIKNKIVESQTARWYAYLSKVKEVDKWKFWAGLHYWPRFLIRLTYFLTSLFFYFK